MHSLARRVLPATAPVGLLAFWGGMWMAARRYPSEFDWRYMTISSLVYPDRNPAGHQWASAGIFLCGLCGLCCAALLARGRHVGAGGKRPVGVPALAVGGFCMALSAWLPERLLPVPKGHELLALTAFFSLSISIVQMTFQAAEPSLRRWTGGAACRVRAYASIVAGAALAPILLTAIAVAYVAHARPELKWVSLSWRALGVPVYLSFAFWEWATCAIFSAYVAGLCLAALARARHSAPDAQANGKVR